MNGVKIDAQVSVIVATMASPERAKLLQQAIATIRASSKSPIWIIVVVNGSRFDTTICDWLNKQPDVQFEYVAEPSYPGAVLRGRELVKTEFFSTLDDDDEYLPLGTDQRMMILQGDPRADLVVTNAFMCTTGADHLFFDQLVDVPADPMHCLMRFNWLTSGNALYRAATVDIDFFRNYHPYAEWTWLAYRLALAGKHVAIGIEPTCRHNASAESLSKTSAYSQSFFPLFQRMLDLSPPQKVANMIHRKISSGYHDASVSALLADQPGMALRYHWHSLIRSGGARYLSYTRHILMAFAQRRKS